MIIHKIKLKEDTDNKISEYKKIYISCSSKDIKTRDLLISFKQRWSFFTTNTFDFLYSETNIDNLIKCDGIMVLVSKNIKGDLVVSNEILFALENRIPLVGVDIRQKEDEYVPEVLKNKMIKYGWEWFSDFIDSL